jgi:hypothetical protein
MTSVNAIVWKARCIIATVTGTGTEIVEGPAHIILHSLPLRPRFRQCVSHVHVSP